MKKLMIAAAIVCTAAFAQAGSVLWNSSYLNPYGQPGDDPDPVSGMTVYLMVGSASDWFDTYKASGFDTAVAGALSSATQLATKLSDPTVGAMDGNNVKIDNQGGLMSLFMVMEDSANKAIYISEVATDTVPTGVGSTPFAFTHDYAYENGAVHDLALGYAGAGYYSAVPEPTSGLLLLLGVAGLALRRRRA